MPSSAYDRKQAELCARLPYRLRWTAARTPKRGTRLPEGCRTPARGIASRFVEGRERRSPSAYHSVAGVPAKFRVPRVWMRVQNPEPPEGPARQDDALAPEMPLRFLCHALPAVAGVRCAL